MSAPPRRRTPGHRLLRGIAALALGLVGTLTVPGGTAHAEETREAPLTVRLTTLAPAAIPRRGPIRVTGTVTNDSTETWDDIKVYPFVSSAPITTPAALAEAVRTPEDADVGGRLTDDLVAIGGLAPGRTAAFTLTVPRADLDITGDPGVYWFGAHALGADSSGRDGTADGRARTFMPLLPAGQARTKVAVVLPFRAKVRRSVDGALRNPDSWRALLRPSGRLGRVLGVAEEAGGRPLTVVVDPAVLDAARTAGNGATDPSTQPTGGGSPSGSGSPSASPSASASPGADASGSSDADAAERRAPGAAQARAWLRRLRALTDSTQVGTLALGYADPDVAALGHRSPALLGTAYTLGRSTLESYGVSADPVAAPPDGYLPGDVLGSLGADVGVLVGNHGAERVRPSWRASSGQHLVFASTETADGGPGPTSPTEALAMRQRIVAQAALRAIAGLRSPLVVSLPSGWEPGRSWVSANFFGGMDLPWLRLTGLPGDDAGLPVRSSLSYPVKARDAELSGTLVDAAKRVVATAGVYADALVDPAGTVDGLTRLALQATSYYARVDPGGAQADADDVTRGIEARLRGIRISVGSPQVTMSGGSGVIVVTVINDLPRRVQVGLRARTDSRDLTIEPHDAVVLPAGQRTTVRLKASSQQIGVHQVRLSPVTDQGDPVGTPLELTVRSSQVGALIWGVMAAGGALLVVMIARRWIRRGLRRRSPSQ